MKIKLALLAIFATTISLAQSTDTLKVMSYNLLNFPQESPGRISDLKIIVQEAQPDIFMICELTSASGGNAVLNDALNQDGITHYAKANYVTGQAGTENLLFYNDDKLELYEQNEIYTVLRDINEYVLYYESSDLATTADTTFFYCYVAHLKASQGFESQRNQEAQAMKDFMATRAGLENVLLGGDFNLYGSSEPAWSTILSGAGVTLVDPINTPGEWHTDWTYEDVHTQSTRTTSIDFGAGGGMDDRFDFIFMSPDLQAWGNQARYIDGTYWAYGQDGNHYNDDINASPTNTSLPAPVIQALYDMSDHLPVYMEVEVQTAFNGIIDVDHGIRGFYQPDFHKIKFEFEKDILQLGRIVVVDMSGQEVMSFGQLDNENSIDLNQLESGVYMLKESNFGFSMKFVR